MVNKTIIHEFDPVIYPYKLWVVVAKSPIDIAERFNGYNNKPIENIVEDTKQLDAFVMQVQRKSDSMLGALIYFSSKHIMTYGIVSHECTHAAKHLFEHINANINPHEPFEYIVEWMADCCEVVKKYKHSNKNNV
jgi:hypothetical protein